MEAFQRHRQPSDVEAWVKAFTPEYLAAAKASAQMATSLAPVVVQCLITVTGL